MARQQSGMDAHVQGQGSWGHRIGTNQPIHALGHGQQLHHVAQLGGIAHIAGVQPIDTLGSDRGTGHGATKSKRRQDGNLVGSVVPLHIGGRIGLGIAETLGIGEHGTIGGPLISHAAEDVVGGAIDDAAHPGDAVAAKRLLQGLDDRNAPPHRRLDQHIHPAAEGGGGNLLPMAGDDGLVGGHHRLAGGDGPQDQGSGRLQATHHLHHDLHSWIVHHCLRIRAEQGGIHRQGPRPRRIPNGHPPQGQLPHQGMAPLWAGQDSCHASPHRAQPEQANADGHGPIPQTSHPRKGSAQIPS